MFPIIPVYPNLQTKPSSVIKFHVIIHSVVLLVFLSTLVDLHDFVIFFTFLIATGDLLYLCISIFYYEFLYLNHCKFLFNFFHFCDSVISYLM